MYTQNGQLILIMKYLEYTKECKYLFSTNSLIKSETPASWSRLEFINNSMGLLNIFSGKSGKIFDRYFAKKIIYVWLLFLRLEREKGSLGWFESAILFMRILKNARIISFLNLPIVYRSLRLLLK